MRSALSVACAAETGEGVSNGVTMVMPASVSPVFLTSRRLAFDPRAEAMRTMTRSPIAAPPKRGIQSVRVFICASYTSALAAGLNICRVFISVSAFHDCDAVYGLVDCLVFLDAAYSLI